MSDAYRSLPGVFGPREVEILASAYRSVLQEICDSGALSDLAHSSLSAREMRRLAAREVIAAASSGSRSLNEVVTRSLSRMVSAPAG